MSDTVNRIQAKIARAKYHVEEFGRELRAFYKASPYEVRRKENAEARERIYYLAKMAPVPHALEAIAADALQDLRSSLDHVAYQLVVDANGGAEPGVPVQYPICPSAADYKATSRGHIKGVRQEVIDAIDATEPYKGGKGHALWQLHHLNRLDKHRLLILNATVEDGIDLVASFVDTFKDTWPTWAMNAWREMPTIFLRGAESPALNVGDVLRCEPIDAEVNEKRRFSFAVTLHVPGIIQREPTLEVLHNMAKLVDNIVMRLCRFLP